MLKLSLNYFSFSPCFCLKASQFPHPPFIVPDPHLVVLTSERGFLSMNGIIRWYLPFRDFISLHRIAFWVSGFSAGYDFSGLFFIIVFYAITLFLIGLIIMTYLLLLVSNFTPAAPSWTNRVAMLHTDRWAWRWRWWRWWRR